MFAQIDEMTDEPVSAELVSGERIRVAYGRSVVFSLDIGEAVDLVDAIATTLALLSELPEKGYGPARTPRPPEDLFGDGNKNNSTGNREKADHFVDADKMIDQLVGVDNLGGQGVFPGLGKKGVPQAHTLQRDEDRVRADAEVRESL